MSNLVAHAERELDAAGLRVDGDDFDRMMRRDVLDLVQRFADQRHSGGSAPICAALFRRLVAFEPLAPLQGTEEEWVEVATGVLQNRRCGHVFKEQGEAYDIRGPGGRAPVTFPYLPPQEP